MKKTFFIAALFAVSIIGCKSPVKEKAVEQTSKISKIMIDQLIKSLTDSLGSEQVFRIERGVNQVAALWTPEDGSEEDFSQFCKSNFIYDQKKLEVFFEKLQRNFEVLNGNFVKMQVELMEPIHMDGGEITPIDELFGAYSPSAHVSDDFYKNKIAFITALNFPFYSLKEKSDLGEKWSRKEWAYARMGDMFISRVPADLLQKVSETTTNADTYISQYNIFMGNLIDKDQKTYFPADRVLITHWGLRDELKSNYNSENGLFKQKMIYEVMKRIIDQSIPEQMINSDKYQWDPMENKVFEQGKTVEFKGEQNIRYQHLLNNFQSMQAIDAYSPHYPTYIKRKFESDMEISQEEVEKIFTDFVSSPVVKEVAELIKKRLGRNLEPFDIWYSGFKSRSSTNEESLDKLVGKKYPNANAFERDIPNMLRALQFKPNQATEIASKIRVDAARGSGHAWGAAMKTEKARLRTRIPATGMNYKGYNIAIHELGHNVEQTITLQNVDYYVLNGVPNTAFTEALAFNFQKRDLLFLGMKEDNPNKKYFMALDNFWSSFEIMGVSLVDMKVWKWMYENPKATSAELKDVVIRIAKEVWNAYYAPVFGKTDEPILAIYSHMIDNPLYLSAYPIGHLIDFQIEKQIEGKQFADEIYRIFTQGRIIPQLWMKNAVGKGISIEPTLEATKEAVKKIVN